MKKKYVPTWAQKSHDEMAGAIAAPVIDYGQRQEVHRLARLYLDTLLPEED